MEHGIIYKHQNKLNGKVYIGQTTKDPERRWRKNSIKYNSYRNNDYFHRTLVKHGWDIFETTILASALSQKDLDYLEVYFILQYDCLQPRGYNSRLGGNGGKMSDSTKEKLSKIRKANNHLYKELPEGMLKRKEHIIINNVEHKECRICKENKQLTEFHKYSRTWDKLTRECKNCRNEYKKVNFGYKRKSEEEVKESYIKRTLKSKESLKEYFTEDKKREKSLSYGGYTSIDSTTTETINYECGYDLKKLGFNIAGVSGAVTNGYNYKGKKWFKT